MRDLIITGKNYCKTGVSFFVLIIVFNFILTSTSFAQKVIINGYDSIFELNGGPGSCLIKPGMTFCSNTTDSWIFSSALYNDTLFFITGRGTDLYKATLNDPGSCRFLTNLPDDGRQNAFNSLTVDLYGRVYGISIGGLLFRYDGILTQPVVLGFLPKPPGGDMLYYNGHMFYATTSGEIYQINLEDPSQSILYMSVSQYTFIGLISFPFDCDKNKVYGIANSFPGSKLVGLDMENKTLTGEECYFPVQIFDAASVVEDGKTAGIIIDSITMKVPCDDAQNTGSVYIHAFTATKGAMTYKLDGMSNNSGIFNDISLGVHNVSITNARNCIKDTVIELKSGLSSYFQINTIYPMDCSQNDGEIRVINAFTNYPPVQYSINGGPFGSANIFGQLPGGTYSIRLRDAVNCIQDTVISLRYKNKPSFLSQFTVQPTTCNRKSGSIAITVNGNPQELSTSLDNGPLQHQLLYNNLEAKEYLVSIFKGSDCRYDTIINVPMITDKKPDIKINVRQPKCGFTNGKIGVKVNGPEQPFAVSINDVVYQGSSHDFDGLASGTYQLNIINNNGCMWDTAVKLDAFIAEPITISYDKINPTCKLINSGSVKVRVTGNASPYLILYNNKNYTSGELISGLPPGAYALPVINNLGCTRDTVHVELTVTEEPECDRFFMPNAFTPNHDGLNDYAKPFHSPFLRNVDMKFFNRYGQVVYLYKGSGNGWDGQFNNSPQPAGGYTWLITYINFNGEFVRKYGTLILIR